MKSVARSDTVLLWRVAYVAMFGLESYPVELLQATAIVKKEEAKAAELQRREGLHEERSALYSTIESEFLEEVVLAKRGVPATEIGSKKLKGFVEEVSTADGPAITAHGRSWDMLDRHLNVANVTLTCCHVPRYAASLLRLQVLTNLTTLTLKRCAIENIAQLLPLQYLSSVAKLNLPDNPVQLSPLLRPFVIWKMPNVAVLDGSKFSTQDIKLSSSLFEPFSRHVSDFYKYECRNCVLRAYAPIVDVRCRDFPISTGVTNALLSSAHVQFLAPLSDQCVLLFLF
jgi:hypothetical protein